MIDAFFEIAEEQSLEFRDAFFGERYLNDPVQTPEADLITEILMSKA